MTPAQPAAMAAIKRFFRPPAPPDIDTPRLYFGGSLSSYSLRPRHHRPVQWPWVLVCLVALIAVAQWAPVIRGMP